MTPLLRLMDTAVRDALETVAKEGGYDNPHCLAETPDGELTMYALHMPSNMARLMLMRDFLEKKVVAYVVVWEAWVARYEEGEPRVQPKDHPKRQDVLVVQGEDLDGNEQVRTWVIDKRAKTTTERKPGAFKSEFSGLLKMAAFMPYMGSVQ
jgi:hypothetical protein